MPVQQQSIPYWWRGCEDCQVLRLRGGRSDHVMMIIINIIIVIIMMMMIIMNIIIVMIMMIMTKIDIMIIMMIGHLMMCWSSTSKSLWQNRRVDNSQLKKTDFRKLNLRNCLKSSIYVYFVCAACSIWSVGQPFPLSPSPDAPPPQNGSLILHTTPQSFHFSSITFTFCQQLSLSN